jgi:hypothetical protein
VMQLLSHWFQAFCCFLPSSKLVMAILFTSIPTSPDLRHSHTLLYYARQHPQSQTHMQLPSLDIPKFTQLLPVLRCLPHEPTVRERSLSPCMCQRPPGSRC